MIEELIKATILEKEHLGENLKRLCIEYIDNLQQQNLKLKKQNKTIQEKFKEWKKDIEKERKFYLCERDCAFRLKESKKYLSYTQQIEQLQQENKELKERINKAIDYIRSNDIEVLKYHDIPSETTSYEIVTIDLLKILKG